MSSITGQSQVHRTTAASHAQATRRESRVAIHRESGARRVFGTLRAAWRRGAELSRAIDQAKDTAWQAPDGPSHRLLG